MEFIILTKSHKRFALNCNALFLFTSLSFLFVGVVASVFFIGSEYGVERSKDRINSFYTQAGRVWSDEIEVQRLELENAREDAGKHLDTMASRLSTLQAHIFRLNALGSRLAKKAGMDEMEFNSDRSPGIGGPRTGLEQANTIPDFLTELDKLAVDIEDRGEKLLAMESLLIDETLQLETLPHGNPLVSGWVSSLFGWRIDPINGKKGFHSGMDFSGRPGSKIGAAGSGIVIWSGIRQGYGYVVEINHGNGYVTRYAHNKKNLVLVGEKVEKGQEIAIIGSTGRSTGLHVHFEVLHNGKHVNPKKFVVSK